MASQEPGTDDLPGAGGVEPLHAFSELARIDLAVTPLGAVLRRVAALAMETIPDVCEVSVTLVDEGRARSVAFTGDLAVHLDERQYEVGFGPCVDAARNASVVRIDDTSTDTRYAEFSAVAHRSGVQSSLSVGMPMPRNIHAGLNLYSREQSAFDEETAELAQTYADYAAVALANAALVDAKTALASQLEEAMGSRAVIEQAKGALAVTRGCTPEEAFRHLVQESRNSNRKLREVAAEVVSSLGPRRSP